MYSPNKWQKPQTLSLSCTETLKSATQNGHKTIHLRVKVAPFENTLGAA